ncbi:MAG: Hpt domain-containing protein, partial [Candidatus Krumholzibacteria bacterium]|nr:Hpt domain-containing protein [Candidatus Krumholzibacteria bacterium]
MKVSDYKELYRSEADDIFHALENGVISLESGEDRQANVDELFRYAHNLKGISGAMGYDSVVTASHAIENFLDAIRKGELNIKQDTVDALLEAVDMLRECVALAVEDKDSNRRAELAEKIAIHVAGIDGDDSGTAEPASPTEDSGERDPETADGSRAEFREPIKTTRVELERLDRIMTLVGELIISRIRF